MGSISAGPRRRHQGSAVIVLLALLAIMLVLLAANTATLNWLRAEVNRVEKSQVQRLAEASAHPFPPAGSSAQ